RRDSCPPARRGTPPPAPSENAPRKDHKDCRPPCRHHSFNAKLRLWRKIAEKAEPLPMLTAARPAPSPDTGINPFARSLDYEYGSKGSGELRDVEARSGAARDRRPGRKQVGEGAARMSTGRRVARNAALLMVMRVLLQLIGLGSTVVLARLLMPEDFGLV